MATEIVEYTKTEAALSDLAARYKGVVFDVTTTEGMQTARKGRAELRTYRVDLEKTRVSLKEGILKQGRLIDGEAKRITSELESLENPIDAQIKKEEKRKEDERNAAIRAEQERKAAEEAAAKAAEEKRMADERAALDRERAELEAKRKAQEAADRAAREKLEAEQRAARQKIEDDERAARLAREDADRKARQEREAQEAEAKRKRDAEEADLKAAREKLETEQREVDEQKRRAQEMAMSEINGIQQQTIIAQIGRAGVRVGGTIECIEETLKETEAWPMEHFNGALKLMAQSAKDKAVNDIREILAAAKEKIKREAAEVADREARRVEAERADARAMLSLFVERYGKLPEFAAIAKQIGNFLKSAK